MYLWNLGCCVPGTTEANKLYKQRFLQKCVLFPSAVILYQVTFTCGNYEIQCILLGTMEGPSTALGVSVMWQLSCLNPNNKDHKTLESMISAYTGDVSWHPGPARPPRWPPAETTRVCCHLAKFRRESRTSGSCYRQIGTSTGRGIPKGGENSLWGWWARLTSTIFVHASSSGM